MSVTIEDVMARVSDAMQLMAIAAQCPDEEEEQQTQALAEHQMDIARRGILALVAQARDEEAEACAAVCEARGAQFYPESPFSVEIHALSEGIRARIAGRKA